MSLSKLWNSKYLLQNIKKSRMTIILFFIIVPIFTSLMIIAAGDEAFDFTTLASVNIMGMYIIPFIFSICLFGYVFKKNSTDFIGSMPISRRCIFVTNTIGGIALIVLMQLITLILTLIVSSLTEGVLFFSMALDIFIYQTIAYIFVFTIANLAMTFSGTTVAQIALTMLIAFVIPFSAWYVDMMSDGISMGTSYSLINDNIELMKLDKVSNCTAPFLAFVGTSYSFNVISIIKMSILSILYFAIGLYLFNKKKMETANESYENKIVHFIVKGLTLIPFVAILKALTSYEEETLAIIIFAIIVVYYFVFDLMTGKKINFGENILALTVSIALLYGVYGLAIGINEKIERKIDLNSIKVASFKINNLFYTKTTDKDKISSTIVSLVRANNRYGYEDYRNYGVYIELTDAFGRKYYEYVYINRKTIEEIFDESFDNIEISSNAIICNYDLKLTKAERDEIFKELGNSLKDLTIKQMTENEDNLDYLGLELKEYINHELVEISYPVTLNKKMEEILISAYNRNAVKYLRSGLHDIYYMIDTFDKFDDDTIDKVWFVTGSMRSEDLITDFILANADNIPKDLTNCIGIRTSKFRFYTDKVQEFLDLINKYCEEHSEEFEYTGGK